MFAARFAGRITGNERRNCGAKGVISGATETGAGAESSAGESGAESSPAPMGAAKAGKTAKEHKQGNSKSERRNDIASRDD